MKHKLPILIGVSVLVLTGAIAVWNAKYSKEPVQISSRSDLAANDTLSHSRSEELLVSSESAGNEERDADSVTVDLLSVRDRFHVDYDPMIVHALGEFSDAEIAAYNELHVIPFNKQVGENCWKEQSEFLPGEFVTVCDPIRERPPHAYESIEMTELRELAETDSAAAITYAERITDASQKLVYHLQAAALSGKSGPLIALAEKSYRFDTALEQTEEGVVQTLLPENLVRRLALETIAKRMGDPRARPDYWRSKILSMKVDDASSLVKTADTLSAEWFRTMKAIPQSQIVGEMEGSGWLSTNQR